MAQRVLIVRFCCHYKSILHFGIDDLALEPARKEKRFTLTSFSEFRNSSVALICSVIQLFSYDPMILIYCNFDTWLQSPAVSDKHSKTGFSALILLSI